MRALRVYKCLAHVGVNMCVCVIVDTCISGVQVSGTCRREHASVSGVQVSGTCRLISNIVDTCIPGVLVSGTCRRGYVCLCYNPYRMQRAYASGWSLSTVAHAHHHIHRQTSYEYIYIYIYI